MDCDTTGIEPDFSLVKFKKLAGGGYFKIVNQSVPEALRRMGYGEAELQEIVAYVSGTNTLLAAPQINRATLKEKGLTNEDLAKVEAAIPGGIRSRTGLRPLDSRRRGVRSPWGRYRTRKRPGFSLLKTPRLFGSAGRGANETIIGRMTIEGAPYLKKEHYAVFDCANRCGRKGKRFLAPMAHIKMMAATQPFLSGAISKTVNLPNEATVDEVQKIYEEGWRLGLKAVALYRDGCKASQPLSSSSDTKTAASADEKKDGRPTTTALAVEARPTPRSPAEAKRQGRQDGRMRLPGKRHGFTQEARVGGHKVFLRTGEYPDGTLGEIFLDLHKEGAAFRSIMNCFAMAVSVGLQYGVPLEAFVEQYTFTRFEPQGIVDGHANVKMATSIVDYLFRVLGIEYLHRYDLAHVPPVDASPTQDPVESKAQETIAAATAPKALSLPEVAASGSSALDAQLDEMMGDAPVCDSCGHITVRNGACYKCLNCGNSMGCS